MIGYQYWVVSVPNGFEAWSNFRRTGYPNLAPNPYPASEIPGHLSGQCFILYGEFVANKANVDAAIANQGGTTNTKMNGKGMVDKP